MCDGPRNRSLGREPAAEAEERLTGYQNMNSRKAQVGVTAVSPERVDWVAAAAGTGPEPTQVTLDG